MFEVRKFDGITGTPGFSEGLIVGHFRLYEGYVGNTNRLIQIMKEYLEKDMIMSAEFAEIKRRFGWEFNGMRLHELYFENINREENELDSNSHLFKKIEHDFGSFANWETGFKAVGTMRGIGWAILYYDPVSDRMFNFWINEHDGGHPAGLVPIIVMDVFEHAYMADYGLDRKTYINAFMNALDWSVAEKRYDSVRK